MNESECTGNETLTAIEEFITTQQATYLYASPEMHQTTMAEKAVKAWKNHFKVNKSHT